MAGKTSTPERKHERSDVSVRMLVWFLAGLIVAAVVIHVGLALLWRYFAASEPPSVSRWIGPRNLPPSPRLQVAPEIDMNVYLANQRKWLTTYGWVDRSKGIVRIPITEAMELTVKKGLAYRPAPPQPPRTPVEVPYGVKNEPSANY